MIVYFHRKLKGFCFEMREFIDKYNVNNSSSSQLLRWKESSNTLNK